MPRSECGSSLQGWRRFLDAGSGEWDKASLIGGCGPRDMGQKGVGGKMASKGKNAEECKLEHLPGLGRVWAAKRVRKAEESAWAGPWQTPRPARPRVGEGQGRAQGRASPRAEPEMEPNQQPKTT